MAKKQSKIVDLKGRKREEAECVTPAPEQKTLEQLGYDVAADWMKVISNLSSDGDDTAVAMNMFLQRIGVLQVLGEQILSVLGALGTQTQMVDSMVAFMMLRQGRPVISKDGSEAFATMYEEWKRGWMKHQAKQLELAKQAAEGEVKNDKADDGKEHGEADKPEKPVS